MNEFICPTVKCLDLHCYLDYDVSFEQLPKMFPNLECLYIGRLYITAYDKTESLLVTLLNELKLLKTLSFYGRTLNFHAESVLQCIRDHGANLEDFQIGYDDNFKEGPLKIDYVPGFNLYGYQDNSLGIKIVD
jgi:hypothetical protein